MTNCSHCGSRIKGKATSIKLKEFRLMYFHEDPSECYVKEPMYNHNFPDIIRQELRMFGTTV